MMQGIPVFIRMIDTYSNRSGISSYLYGSVFNATKNKALAHLATNNNYKNLN